MEQDLERLCEFLAQAKKTGYAGATKRPKRTDIGAKEYTFQDREYSYKDIYYGSALDICQEIV